MHIDYFCGTLFGGDQLTVARAIGAQTIRANSEDDACRLEGLIPVVDWHTKVCFLGVSVTCIGVIYSCRNFSCAGDLE